MNEEYYFNKIEEIIKSMEENKKPEEQEEEITEEDKYVFDLYAKEERIKSPITINYNNKNMQTKELRNYLIDNIKDKLVGVKTGYALAGKRYKISYNYHAYFLDLLLFDIELNAFVVIRVVSNKAKYDDVDKLKFYTTLVDNKEKTKNNHKTIGLLICKDYDSNVADYAANKKNIFLIKYKLVNKNKN